MNKNRGYYLRITAVIFSVLFMSVYAEADIYILPCVYRAEVMTVNHTADVLRTDIARIGSHYVGTDRLDFYTWAEFDITPLHGKTVSNAGLMVYNEWSGTQIGSLRYTSYRPSVSNMYRLYSQHTLIQNRYNGFAWTVNAGNAWTPAQGFYLPDWENYPRSNGNTLTDDLQAHADDPEKSWFAVEFSYLASGRSNFRFPDDYINPAAIIMAVVTESDFLTEKNRADVPAPVKPVRRALNLLIFPPETNIILTGISCFPVPDCLWAMPVITTVRVRRAVIQDTAGKAVIPNI